MTFTIYVPTAVGREEFVAHWSALYDYRVDESLYTPYLGRPLTPEAVRKLFRWKNGTELSGRKHRSVEKNFVARVTELAELPEETDPATFLRRFSAGGAIWRIFWLHCWRPERFPIYDQHVHRAMVHIETGRVEEIT